MLLKNLHHFSDLRDNLQFNAIWYRRSTESAVTVTPLVTCMDRLHQRCNHVAHLISSSTAWVFLTNMNEKCKPASPNTIQVKDRKKRVVSQLERSERVFDL
jgi:hypothetical protein